MTNTIKSGLPLLGSGALAGYVLANDLYEWLDWAVMPAVELADEPASGVVAGTAYIVGDAPAGDFDDPDCEPGDIAVTFNAVTWVFVTPSAGMPVWRTDVGTGAAYIHNGTEFVPAQPRCMSIEVIPKGTTVTTGTAKRTFPMPFAAVLVKIPTSNTFVASSSGVVTCDIKEAGTSILHASNKLSIDQSELSSDTAATATSFVDTLLAKGATMTIDVTAAGTGADGLWVHLYLLELQ